MKTHTTVLKTRLVYFLLFFVFCIAPVLSFSQFRNTKVENNYIREMVVEESGIHALSVNSADTIVVDLTSNAILYCYPDSTFSFWYKIYAKKDCEISLDIFPANADNTYNFFLYKNRGDFNISDIKDHNIYPIRANLFKDEMETTGTGLSRSSNVNYNDAHAETRVKQFYHTAYHSAVPVIKGDVLILNIYHIKGVDCGQQFILETNTQSQKFQSLYVACYKDRIATAKIMRKVKLPQPVVSNNECTAKLTGSYRIWDSVKHHLIDVETVWTKKLSNSCAMQKGTGEIVLEKNTAYTVSFSAIGYKSKSVSFVVKDSLFSFTRNVFLAPLKEGEDFVMDKIYFYPNTYSIKPGATAEMERLVKYLLSNPEVVIEIQGFTNGNNRIKVSRDDMGEGGFTGSSKKLSKLRAETIKQYLVQKGISETRLFAYGYGGSKMIYSRPRNQEEANKNIRVGILILSQKEIAYSTSKR
jgi:outer membrane protein OmpA-like peptidoglycan-associated protein